MLPKPNPDPTNGRPPPPSRLVKSAIEELRDEHREMARLVMRGWTDAEIGRYFGVETPRIQLIRNSPIFQEHLRSMHERADLETVQFVTEQELEIQRLSLRATEVMREILEMKCVEAKETKLQFDAARDILDRAGFKPVDRHNVEVTNKREDEELGRIYEELKAEVVEADTG